MQAVNLKLAAEPLQAAARVLALEPGSELVARVLDAPAGGGRGLLALAGGQLPARLPRGVEPGQTLRLQVLRVDGDAVLLRISHAGEGDAAGPALAQAAGSLAVAGDGELLRAALSMAGSQPLWLPDGGAAELAVDPDEDGGGDGAAPSQTASFVLHSPQLGALEVRLRMTAAGIQAAVMTAPGDAARLAEQGLPDLVARLAAAAGRPAAAAVSERPPGRPPPPRPEGRIDVQA
jgi:hypothetical protein